MFCFNPRAWRLCGNVRHLFMPRVAGGVTKAASRRCHRASPGPAASEMLIVSLSPPPCLSFPLRSWEFLDPTPLPAPGWQCRLSPALWGCHRGWPWPCPRCHGFVQDWHSSQPVPFGAKGGLGGSGLFQSLHPSAATPRRDWDSVGLSQGVTRAVPLSPSVPISVLLGSSPPGEMPPPR